jgi:hypothetical protein
MARVDELGLDPPAGYRLVLGSASVALRESMGGFLFRRGAAAEPRW